MLGLGQVRKAAQPGRVVLGHNHDRSIAGKDHGLDDHVFGGQEIHVLSVGRGEHINLGTLVDLHAQVLAAGKVEADLHIGMSLLEGRPHHLEDFAQ